MWVSFSSVVFESDKCQNIPTVCYLDDFILHKRAKPAKIGEKNRVNGSTACFKGGGEKKKKREHGIYLWWKSNTEHRIRSLNCVPNLLLSNYRNGQII